MFNQDFHPNTDQYNPGPEFGPEVHTLAEVYTYQAPDEGEHERYDTDNENRVGDAVPSGHSGTSKGDAYGQGVDTGCYGQSQDYQQAGRVEVMFLLVAETLLDHPYTQEEEQTEGYPVVVLLDEAMEMIGGKPTHQRHHGLEKSEEEADGEKRFPAYTA